MYVYMYTTAIRTLDTAPQRNILLQTLGKRVAAVVNHEVIDLPRGRRNVISNDERKQQAKAEIENN